MTPKVFYFKELMGDP